MGVICNRHVEYFDLAGKASEEPSHAPPNPSDCSCSIANASRKTTIFLGCWVTLFFEQVAQHALRQQLTHTVPGCCCCCCSGCCLCSHICCSSHCSRRFVFGRHAVGKHSTKYGCSFCRYHG